ncbi:MAG: ribonuclease HI [Patescibacteria group bacterium]|mgnify:CR=1 FL=1
MNNKITVFTDGACRGNPGRGGWAAIIVDSQKVLELGGRERMTTNNRMEMTAAIKALKKTPKEAEVVLYTDSSYLINGITKWVKGWKRNGWKRNNWLTKTKEEVLNKDLWMKLDALTSIRTVDWFHISGHAGIAGNERCDGIATAFADSEPVKLFDDSLEKYNIPNILEVNS